MTTPLGQRINELELSSVTALIAAVARGEHPSREDMIAVRHDVTMALDIVLSAGRAVDAMLDGYISPQSAQLMMAPQPSLSVTPGEMHEIAESQERNSEKMRALTQQIRNDHTRGDK